jgi:hypothetical protein
MSDSNLSPVLEKSDQQTLRALVRDTLERCLKDDPSYAAIKHPLGFLRVPIIRTPSTGLYVHIWTQLIDLPRPSTSAIHAHNWHLLSRVIAGTVTNQVFNAQELERLESLPSRTFPKSPVTGSPGYCAAVAWAQHGHLDLLRDMPSML